MKFGEMIKVSKKYQRHENSATDRRTWVLVPIKPVVCLVIGERTLCNGTMHYGGFEDMSYLYDKEYIRALLVVKDMHSKPFYVEMPAEEKMVGKPEDIIGGGYTLLG